MNHHAFIDSPLGRLLVVANDEGLCRINFQEAAGALPAPTDSRHDDAPLRDAVRQLEAYLAGELQSFDLQLAPGGTDFQQRVWAVLRNIPYGATTTYGHIANTLGKPTASRAVGAANGRNPLPIVVPCHRVIGSSGALTGYYGGVHIKRFLLRLEGVDIS